MSTIEVTPLGAFWPLFLLAHGGEGRGPLLDQLCPHDPAGLRAAYRPVFEATNPAAAAGLDATEDRELAYWCAVLRGPLLTGARGELMFLDPIFLADGVMLTELARLLTLPLYERQDAFLAAMHARGQA